MSSMLNINMFLSIKWETVDYTLNSKLSQNASNMCMEKLKVYITDTKLDIRKKTT